MTRVGAVVLGLVGALALSATAQAADPPGSWRRPQPEPYERPEPRTSELLSGWYLRGDIGYRAYDASLSTSGNTAEKYSNAAAGTLGFGYKYQWFRADLTYDYGLQTRATVSTSAATAQPQYTGTIKTEMAMANAYIDFGTWGGFTPYIGAGAGIARLKSSDFADTIGPIVSPVTTGAGKSEHFAWNWMAGVAFQVATQWVVDIGYRESHMGDVATSYTPGFVTAPPVYRDITAREVRVGVRFLID